MTPVFPTHSQLLQKAHDCIVVVDRFYGFSAVSWSCTTPRFVRSVTVTVLDQNMFPKKTYDLILFQDFVSAWDQIRRDMRCGASHVQPQKCPIPLNMSIRCASDHRLSALERRLFWFPPYLISLVCSGTVQKKSCPDSRKLERTVVPSVPFHWVVDARGVRSSLGDWRVGVDPKITSARKRGWTDITKSHKN